MMPSSTRRRAIAIAALAILATLPESAFAQDGICPAGSAPAVLRVSKLIAGGTLDGARNAVSLHQKWYADHGYAADRILFEPVMTIDATAGRPVPSTDQFVTVHTRSSEVPPAKHDESWQAFVAAYNAQSAIVSTVITCLP